VSQSELIVALLALLLTSFYLDRRRSPAGVRPRDWALLGLGYLAAAFTKEHGLVIPGLLLAAELFLLQGPLRERIRRLLSGYAVLAGLGGLVILARVAVLGGQLAGNWQAEALEGAGLGVRALTMLQLVPQWIRLLVWPAHLQADYSPQDTVASTGFGAMEALGLAILAVAGLIVWSTRRRAPAVAFGLAFAAVAIFPTTNLLLLTSTLLAERQLFLPSAGFLLAVGGALALGWETLLAPPARRRALAVALGALVVAGVARSIERQRTWRNEAFFSVRAVQDAPLSYRTQRAYGEVLFELGRRDLALAAYRRALELTPPGHAWRVRNDLARRLRALGETALESEQLVASLAERPDQLDTRGFLIAAFLALGRYPEAAGQADSALAHGGDPGVFQGLRALADSAARVGAAPGTVGVQLTTMPLSRTPRPPGG
jgi:tetratricopeptide (TPR) repeat protein